VIETRVVMVDYVRIRKRRVTDEQDVRAPVCGEVVTVEELPVDGDMAGDQLLCHGAPIPSSGVGS